MMSRIGCACKNRNRNKQKYGYVLIFCLLVEIRMKFYVIYRGRWQQKEIRGCLADSFFTITVKEFCHGNIIDLIYYGMFFGICRRRRSRGGYCDSYCSFGIPIHVSLGTSLSAMAFTTLSGAYSHYREGNVVLKSGIAVRFFGAFGAFAGAKISAAIQGRRCIFTTGAILYITAVLVYLKVFYPIVVFLNILKQRSNASMAPVKPSASPPVSKKTRCPLIPHYSLLLTPD